MCNKMKCLTCLLLVAGLVPAGSVWAGPKGTIFARGVADGTIAIDGSAADWPLGVFATVAQQPLSPEARIEDATNALGDKIVFDLDRVGYFNGTKDCTVEDCGFINGGPGDFESSIYFAFDSQSLYVLGVMADDFQRSERDTTPWGSQGFFNDGFEMFFDAMNDSDDAVDAKNNPPNVNFDDEFPNLDDFQVTFALNENFFGENATLGARQHLERAAQPELMAGDGTVGNPVFEFSAITDDTKNAPGGIYRDALSAIAGPDIEANETINGFVIEGRIPLGFIDEFQASHDMGFAFFWRDVDDGNDGGLAGGGDINWADWTQNIAVTTGGVTAPGDGLLFNAANWGKMSFTSIADANLDQNVDASDAGAMFGDWGAAGANGPSDLNDDGQVDAADAGIMFAAWTGDLAPADNESASAEYNTASGELRMNVNGAVNVFVNSTGGLITPLVQDPDGVVGLLTNNKNRVGMTNLSPINVSDFSFGSIGAGIPVEDLSLVYSPRLGGAQVTVPFSTTAGQAHYIPEPCGVGMLVLGALGMLWARRR